jgi:hypothetical protein
VAEEITFLAGNVEIKVYEDRLNNKYALRVENNVFQDDDLAELGDFLMWKYATTDRIVDFSRHVLAQYAPHLLNEDN